MKKYIENEIGGRKGRKAERQKGRKAERQKGRKVEIGYYKGKKDLYR